MLEFSYCCVFLLLQQHVCEPQERTFDSSVCVVLCKSRKRQVGESLNESILLFIHAQIHVLTLLNINIQRTTYNSTYFYDVAWIKASITI